VPAKILRVNNFYIRRKSLGHCTVGVLKIFLHTDNMIYSLTEMRYLFLKKFYGILLMLLTVAAMLTPSYASDYFENFTYESHTSSDGSVLPYRLYVPQSYSPENEYPLVIFLHGAGSRGTDNYIQLYGSGLHYMMGFGYDECIIFAPQCPEDSQWVLTPWSDGAYSTEIVDISPQLCAVMDAAGKLCREYRVDLSRLYLTGLSMGGFGTWDLITRYPDIFAAAMPICGSGDPSKGEVLAESQTAIMTFHGTEDPVVPFEGTKATVDAITAAGGNVIFTPYKGMKHDTWTTTYSNPEVYEWMFAQKLSDTTTAESLFGGYEGKETAVPEANVPDDTLTDEEHPAARLSPVSLTASIILSVCALLMIAVLTAIKILKRK